MVEAYFVHTFEPSPGQFPVRDRGPPGSGFARRHEPQRNSTWGRLVRLHTKWARYRRVDRKKSPAQSARPLAANGDWHAPDGPLVSLVFLCRVPAEKEDALRTAGRNAAR